MVIFRVVRGVTDHFTKRMSDWLLAGIFTNFGYVLLLPAETFALSKAFDLLARIANEQTWGTVCFVIGMGRLFFLAINGTFPAFRFTPHMRALLAFLTIFVWAQIALSIASSDLPSTGNAIYKWFVVAEIFNFALAAGEAGEVERRMRSGGRH